MKKNKNKNEDEETPYDLGWISGYEDEVPNCPFEEDTKKFNDWWEGYKNGSNNS